MPLPPCPFEQDSGALSASCLLLQAALLSLIQERKLQRSPSTTTQGSSGEGQGDDGGGGGDGNDDDGEVEIICSSVNVALRRTRLEEKQQQIQGALSRVVPTVISYLMQVGEQAPCLFAVLVVLLLFCCC